MVEDLRDSIISEHCELVYVGSLNPRENRMRCMGQRGIECGPNLCHENLGTFPYIDCHIELEVNPSKEMGRCTCPSLVTDFVAKGRENLRNHFCEVESSPLVIVTPMKLFQESEERSSIVLCQVHVKLSLIMIYQRTYFAQNGTILAHDSHALMQERHRFF